ncbi:hypothetical protein GUJ93_ZPchr0008g12618 [Zizania palustris]|uniref:Ubiquitinyl hydrolase 1 n=1 Tax=Zizania palustris TaxID=103762 RepID=A0A8J5VKI7_ZIZPA|nr:hypothetical protein GUJ93_ZPchr0008g12618 [Zizania palustris]
MDAEKSAGEWEMGKESPRKMWMRRYGDTEEKERAHFWMRRYGSAAGEEQTDRKDGAAAAEEQTDRKDGAAAAEEQTDRKGGATDQGICGHFDRFLDDMAMFISGVRFFEFAPRCEHYLCENKVEKSTILVCMDCNLHFCIGEGTWNNPQGHARWHATMQHHWVGSWLNEPEVLYCFVCEQRLNLDITTIGTVKTPGSITDSENCEHFSCDEEEFDMIFSEINSSKNAPVCQHHGCPITGKTNIMVCTECNMHFCARTMANKRPMGHAREHAQKLQHWVGLWYSDPYQGYCFTCEFILFFGNDEADVHAPRLAKGHGCLIRGIPNLGNTCYLNALLQCLLVVGKLRAMMLGPYTPLGILGEALKELFEEANSVNRAGCLLNPTKLLACIRGMDPRFVGSNMQDSHELLCSLRNGLDNDDNLMMPPKQQDVASSAASPRVIGSIFGGQLSVTTSCRCCSYRSSSYEIIYDISAPLPSERPPPKGIASPPRNISCRSQEKIGTKLFPEVDMSNAEIVQAIAEGNDSHITGLELEGVVIEKTSEPLGVDSTEVEQIPGDIVQMPAKASDLEQNGSAGLDETLSKPEVSIEAMKNTQALDPEFLKSRLYQIQKSMELELYQTGPHSVEGAAEDKGKAPCSNIADDKAEDSNYLASIEECLALHFKAELVEWTCENCSKVADYMSTSGSKDGKHMIESTHKNTVIDGDQTEKSDRITSQSEQSGYLNSFVVECTSSGRKQHGSDSQHQVMCPVDSTAEETTSGIICSEKYLTSNNKADKKPECHEGNQDAVPSGFPAENPANTRDQGQRKQVKLDVDKNQKEQKDRNEGAIQTHLISKLPPVLAIHLKRSLGTVKVRGHVSFEEILDVGQFMEPSSEDKDNSSYRLVGVIEHRGPSTNVGHWVAYVRASSEQPDWGSSSWFCARDSTIREVSLEEVLRRRGWLGRIREGEWVVVVGMEGRVLRRSVTLADQLAAVGPAGPVGSCNLRDLLKLRDEDELAAGRRAAVTLASAMAAERIAPAPATAPEPSSSAAAAAAARTLLDIIRDDQPLSSAGDGGDALFVRRAVSLPSPTTASPPATEVARPPPQETPPRQLPAAAAVSPPPEEEEQGERVSLMALLEQTERQWSAGSEATVREQEQELVPAAASAAEDEPEPETCRGAAGGGCCCVCMTRAKGAAFIPCGHTFCRTCARELLAGRGRCPLCNAAILDVLDIF